MNTREYLEVEDFKIMSTFSIERRQWSTSAKVIVIKPAFAWRNKTPSQTQKKKNKNREGS